jgi:hypothetical protein
LGQKVDQPPILRPSGSLVVVEPDTQQSGMGILPEAGSGLSLFFT